MASSSPLSPTEIISRAKPPITSLNFRPRRNSSCLFWRSSLSNCSPITSRFAAVATSTNPATSPNPSPWSSPAHFRYYRSMLRYFRACLGILLLLLVQAFLPVSAQAPDASTAPLREVHAYGEKLLTEAQVIAITGLTSGAQIGRDDLQMAADKLVRSGFFTKVRFNFQTKLAGILSNYHMEEPPRVPAHFTTLP